MTNVSLTIDGRSATVPAGTSVWDAAKSVGVEIPVLCHSPKLRPVGVCRVCVVDVGARVMAASCVRPCEEGMKVVTNSPKVEKQRKTLVGLLMADHPAECAKERTTADDELDALARRYGVDRHRMYRPTANVARPKDVSSPVIAVDHAACILCDRCIRACDEVQCNEVIGRTGKGYTTRIGFDLDSPMGGFDVRVVRRVRGRLPDRGADQQGHHVLPLARARELKQVDSVCPYCGVGCAITYHVDRGEEYGRLRRGPAGVRQRRAGCASRAATAGTTPCTSSGSTKPLVPQEGSIPEGSLVERGEGQGGQEAGGRRLRRGDAGLPRGDVGRSPRPDRVAVSCGIKRDHGPGALAGFGSAKCSNEEAYLFQKMMRAALGTNNVDHCTRSCHASSVAALHGGDRLRRRVGRVRRHRRVADVLLLTGTNTTVNHPVAATFFKQAAKRGVKMLCGRSRGGRRSPTSRRGTARSARAPTWRSTTALMHVLVTEGRVDAEFVATRTENYDALKALVANYPPERVAPACGIPADTLARDRPRRGEGART